VAILLCGYNNERLAMIVQELRRIQERCGWLPKEEMLALAGRLNVPLHRVHEVASFYPLYRLETPPTVDVKVCRDMACHMNGAPRMTQALEAFASDLDANLVKVCGVSCLGQCDKPVAVLVNDHHVYRGSTEEELRTVMTKAFRRESLPHQHVDDGPLGWTIDVYQGKPNYDAIRQFVTGGKDAAGLLKKLEVSSLRGMGGAGFPTWKKWTAVRGAPGSEKYVVCNADESEPGTFKDRELLRRTPWLTIEGCVLAGLVSGAKRGWIYLRHEYLDELLVLEKALKAAYEMGAIGDNIFGSGASFELEVFVSPGGYVQGEESALLEAMEDRRGEPRNKPPFPVFNGLYNKPTVINNVETLGWVPGIALKGGDWYRTLGVNGESGMRFCSVSGDVAKPGVYEVPFGLKVKDLLYMPKYCGGLKPGRKFKAFAPSGPSGGFLPGLIKPANLPPKFVQTLKGEPGLAFLDSPLGLNFFGEIGAMLGAAHVVYDDTRDLVENALNCVEFYRNESCGKCVPCRTGAQKLVELIGQILAKSLPRTTLPLIGELSEAMSITSICGLGQVASNPIASVMKHFPEEIDRYLRNGA
jgi:NADH:ubiquinone oxidoreductase subunit F (NADH-binding)/NADH:ubiquinone oxidoreductase subunit E